VSDGYRPTGGWEDVRPPFGLGDAEPPRGDAGADAYLCVACWEWHRGALCEDEREEQQPIRRAA
jgi:hypothetical protein